MSRQDSELLMSEWLLVRNQERTVHFVARRVAFLDYDRTWDIRDLTGVALEFRAGYEWTEIPA